MPKHIDLRYKMTTDQWVAMRDGDAIRVAEKVRGLALGVLGLLWVIVSSDKGLALTINQSHHLWILGTGCLAVLSLLFDLLQTLLHLVQVEREVEKFMDDRGEDAAFNYEDWQYKAMKPLFWLKIISSFAACLSLITLLSIILIRPM